jgi:saccharopine dehydrogenase (NAD+, L-lysine forming)
VSDSPLPHTHVQFAHCYKQQAGWSSVLARFYRGGGTLYDLEFLNDANGRRVAAFGFHAGFAGAAAGALAYAAQKNGEKLGRLEPYLNEQAMVTDVKAKLRGREKTAKALIIGALGRCGRGAVDFFRKIGLDEYAYAVSFTMRLCLDLVCPETTLSSGTWMKLPRAGRSRKYYKLTYLSTAYTS